MSLVSPPPPPLSPPLLPALRAARSRDAGGGRGGEGEACSRRRRRRGVGVGVVVVVETRGELATAAAAAADDLAAGVTDALILPFCLSALKKTIYFSPRALLITSRDLSEALLVSVARK